MIDFEKKRIFLTVDVECHNLVKKNYYIDGLINNKCYGLKKILEVGKELNIPINFFYNFSELHKYGEEYVREIISLITSYNQTICLHVHPSFIERFGKPFFWEYSLEEQQRIIELSFSDYGHLCNRSPSAFRAGGYGVNADTYKALNLQSNRKIFDLSYCHAYGSKCRYYNNGFVNGIIEDGNIIIVPNTRFCGMRFLNKKKYVNFDISCCFKNEIRAVFKRNRTNHLICTMHSWSLMKHFYFRDGSLKADRKNIDKIVYLVNMAKEYGYTFSSFDEVLKTNEIICRDEPLDICDSFYRRIIGLFNTFFRMQITARYNKKYLFLYCGFYLTIFLGIVLTIIRLLFIK